MLAESTSVLIATARNANSTEEQLNAAAQYFLAESEKGKKNETEAAMRSIGRHFDLPNPSRSAFLALICGVLVERGGDPLAISDSLTAGLTPLLVSAGELADACLLRMPTGNTDTEGQDPTPAFERALAEVGPSMPSQSAAWQVLDRFWHPAIAIYSASTAVRRSALPLRELAAKISQYHEAGHWLALILTVLDQEPILVIEPETSLGIIGRMSGIVDNFQLNTLLMDTFPQVDSKSHRRVSQTAVDVARGRGPQEQDATVTSVWNLYSWQAVQSDLSLPDAANSGANEFWIWNEGVPADIPVFEGHRVVLLGPQSYPRNWPSQRMFARLAADLECEPLTPDEVNDWLRRMVEAMSGR